MSGVINLTIRSVGPLNNSIPGHSWIEMRHADGRVESYGFYPETSSLSHPGKISTTDYSEHPYPDNISRNIEISDLQALAIRDFARESDGAYYHVSGLQVGDGLVPSYNCATWVVAAMRRASIPAVVEPKTVFPWFIPNYYNNLPDWLKDIFDWITRQTSPLVLDLDGDGVEISLLGDAMAGIINPREARIYFDHDGDGIRSNGSWLKGDDGFLALDINANGTIDNGGELFGSHTRIEGAQTADDGFAALAPQDNNGDGQVTSADAAWQRLLVWRDLNQDGHSQVDELQTLDQLGITSIHVNAVPSLQTLPDGTRLMGQASFVMDGQQRQLTDAWFSQDTFHRQVAVPIEVPNEIKILPEILGSGTVRDLHEAATLSPRLRGLMEQFVQADSSVQRAALIEPIVLAWADTSSMTTSADIYQDQISTGLGFYFSGVEDGSTEYHRWVNRYSALEKFFGQHLNGFVGVGDDVYESLQEDAPGGAAGAGRMSSVRHAWNGLLRLVEDRLISRTIGEPLLDLVRLEITANGRINVDFSELDIAISQRFSESDLRGVEGLLAVSALGGMALAEQGWGGYELLDQKLRALDVTSHAELALLLREFRVGQTEWGDFVIYDLTRNNVSSNLYAAGLSYRSDYLDGNDVVLGGPGGSPAFGSPSNLDAGAGDDVILGGNGDDVVRGGLGNDVLLGGYGNDSLYGTSGHDLYVFNTLSGKDQINELSDDVTDFDLVRFLGVTRAETNISRKSGTDTLLFSAHDGETQVEVLKQFAEMPGGWVPIDAFEFDDVALTFEQIKAAVLEGNDGDQDLVGYVTDDVILASGGHDTVRSGDGNDTLDGGIGSDWLQGDEGSDSINGGEGDDTLLAGSGSDHLDGGSGQDLLYGDTDNDALYGMGGSDLLYGGYGDDSVIGGDDGDQLFGEDGRDDLDGGPGADRLSGGVGDDIYRFDRHGGHDVISEQGSFLDVDRLVFASGIAPSDVVIRAAQDDLVLAFSTDSTATGSVTIEGYFSQDDGRSVVETIEFADGTVWRSGVTQDLIDPPTDVDDAILGTFEADFLTGTAGVDEIFGNFGSDTLIGAGGNDVLHGDEGLDAEWFVATGDVIESDFYALVSQYGWSVALNDLIDGGSGDDLLFGEDGSDSLLGGLGRDTLYGGALADTLDGGAGNDNLTGGSGFDWLLGGEGIDTLNGGEDSDLYVVDHAQDVVIEAYESSGSDTVYALTDYVLPENVEALILDGADNLNAWSNEAGGAVFGNEGSNHLWGGNASDVLSGGLNGLDTLEGGLGNDFYEITDALDRIVEEVNGGYDVAWLYTTAAITLAANIEEIEIKLPDTALRATGNAQNNIMTGSTTRGDRLLGLAGNDTLKGWGGNDTLIGGLGDDRLLGDTGNDSYYFQRGDGVDRIYERGGTNSAVESDKLIFNGNIKSSQLWFSRQANDLVVSLMGGTDSVTVNNWYGGARYQVELIQTAGDAKTLSSDKVDLLVSTMAGFSPPAPGQTELNLAQSSAIAPAWV